MSLECYVCDNQDGNTDKCLNTIKTCEQEDDRCLSIIRWSTTPYWSQVRKDDKKKESQMYELWKTIENYIMFWCVTNRSKRILYREQKSSIMFLKCAQVKQTVRKRFEQQCHFVIISGMRIGSVLSVAREIDVITT